MVFGLGEGSLMPVAKYRLDPHSKCHIALACRSRSTRRSLTRTNDLVLLPVINQVLQLYHDPVKHTLEITVSTAKIGEPADCCDALRYNIRVTSVRRIDAATLLLRLEPTW